MPKIILPPNPGHPFIACTPAELARLTAAWRGKGADHDVVAAVGLTLGDLFERPLEHHRAPVRDRRHIHAAREALKLLAHESLVCLVAAESMAHGHELTDADKDRLMQAVVTIRNAREAAA